MSDTRAKLLAAIDDYASRHFSTGIMHARGQEGGRSQWADQRQALASMVEALQQNAYADGRMDEREAMGATLNVIRDSLVLSIKVTNWPPDSAVFAALYTTEAAIRTTTKENSNDD
jgi:hypothetical protein